MPAGNVDGQVWKRWSWCVVNEGGFIVFLDTSETLRACGNGTLPTGNMELGPLDYATVAVVSIVKIIRHIHGYIGELFLLVGALTLWLPACAFSRVIKDDKQSYLNPSDRLPTTAKFENFQRKYTALKHFSLLINKVFSDLFLCFILASILYFPTSLDGLTVSSQLLHKVRTVSFCLSALVTFVLAADICHKVFTDVNTFHYTHCCPTT